MARARHQARHQASRAEVAAIAARALVDGTARDFHDARRRAARELGLDQARANLADNNEIQQAMIAYLQLFHRQSQSTLINAMRLTARRALQLFEEFMPRLCGPVWDGTAAAGTPISVHLFSDEIERVTRFLLGRAIDYVLDEGFFAFAGSKTPRALPQFHVVLGGEALELSVFPTRGQWRNPLSAIDMREVKRVAIAELDDVIRSGQLFPARNAFLD